ncbi:hypothetical protein E2C01_072060 [Portunus trituberculatus]|uniref:Uncharacterized protein n=1 Tax=Portunus trituberculatus TaxID=210409 RepID=A0A5B7I1L3_PORTR|nr:hypothetical protein [Portunus trituberculatus]
MSLDLVSLNLLAIKLQISWRIYLSSPLLCTLSVSHDPGVAMSSYTTRISCWVLLGSWSRRCSSLKRQQVALHLLPLFRFEMYFI